MILKTKRVPEGTYLPYGDDVLVVGPYSSDLNCYRVGAVTNGIRSGPCHSSIIERVYEETSLLESKWLKKKYDYQKK